MIERTLEKLKTDAWTTAGSRYNAARRIRFKKKFSTLSVAFLSALSIISSVAYSNQASQSQAIDGFYAFSMAILGFFVLILSIIDLSDHVNDEARLLHKNAEKLTHFWRIVESYINQMRSGDAVCWDDARKLMDEYDSIKRDCPYNHETIDFRLFKSSHRGASEFSNADGTPKQNDWDQKKITAKWYLASTSIYLILWALAIILVSIRFFL